MIPSRLLEKRIRECPVHHPRHPNTNIDLSMGRLLFDQADPAQIVGRFYESLSQAIFSGEIGIKQENGDSEIEPDITAPERGRYIEVKAVGLSRAPMFKDYQIEEYRQLQFFDDPIPEARIYFTLFRYNARGIRQRLRGSTTNETLEYFARNTRFMTGLPFSLIYQIYKKGNDAGNHLTERTHSREGEPCTILRTTALDEFFSHPEGTIRQFSFYPGNYEIKRRVLGNLTINDIPVTPFPMVLIKDTDQHHSKWLESIRGTPF